MHQINEWNSHGKIAQYIYNFLQFRTIQVNIRNIQSDPWYTLNGVPQGAIISLTLFLISINYCKSHQQTRWINPICLWLDNLLEMLWFHTLRSYFYKIKTSIILCRLLENLPRVLSSFSPSRVNKKNKKMISKSIVQL